MAKSKHGGLHITQHEKSMSLYFVRVNVKYVVAQKSLMFITKMKTQVTIHLIICKYCAEAVT